MPRHTYVTQAYFAPMIEKLNNLYKTHILNDFKFEEKKQTNF